MGAFDELALDDFENSVRELEQFLTLRDDDPSSFTTMFGRRFKYQLFALHVDLAGRFIENRIKRADVRSP